MAGIYGSSAEDKYFESMLHRHLADQDTTDYAEFIEASVKEYLKGEFSPFTPKNVNEALVELEFGQLTQLSARLVVASKLEGDVSSRVSTVDLMLDFIKDYWTKQATAKAQSDWEKGM